MYMYMYMFMAIYIYIYNCFLHICIYRLVLPCLLVSLCKFLNAKPLLNTTSLADSVTDPKPQTVTERGTRFNSRLGPGGGVQVER